MFDCDQKMLRTRCAGLEHGLHSDAIGSAAVGGDDYACIRTGQHGFQERCQGIQCHLCLVQINMAGGCDGQGNGSLGLYRRGVSLREIDRQRMQVLHRQRSQHESGQQEEHHIDHRDDFDAPAFVFARFAQLHCLSPGCCWFSRILSIMRVPRRSISSSTRTWRREKKLNPNNAKMAMRMPKAVAISACATPPVTPLGSTSPVPPIRLNACIMPVMVPSSPSRGAPVTMVSNTHMPRPMPSSMSCASSLARDSSHQTGLSILTRTMRKNLA